MSPPLSGVIHGIGTLERNDFSSTRHPTPGYCWSMIFFEDRFPLFGIML
jgi:hypothetical protein